MHKNIYLYFIQKYLQVPVYNCKPAHVHLPTQEKLHRKKCLLPDTTPGEIRYKNIRTK